MKARCFLHIGGIYLGCLVVLVAFCMAHRNAPPVLRNLRGIGAAAGVLLVGVILFWAVSGWGRAPALWDGPLSTKWEE